MNFPDATPAATLGGPTDTAAAAAAAAAVDPKRRDGIRAALDQGVAPRPELATAATALRSMRARGFRPDELEAIRSATADLDASEFSAVRDHAWAIGSKPERFDVLGNPDPAAAAPVGHAGPEIDLDDLFGGSPQLAAMCRLASSIVLCSTDLPALVILAVASAAVAMKAVGRCRNPVGSSHWTGPPTLYLAAEVASGESKSLVRGLLAAGLERRAAEVALWHAELAQAEGGKRKFDDQRRVILTRELAGYAKSNDAGAAREVGREIARIEEAAAAPLPKAPKWLQWGAVTPERFAQQAAAGGFVALFPDEGKSALTKFLGDGAGGREYVDPLLTAFSGDFFTHETISGEQRGDRARFLRFRASLFFPIQPGVLSPATQADGALLARMAQRGFLARMLIARPRRASSAERPALRAAARAAQGDAAAVRKVRAEFDELMAGLLHGDGRHGGAEAEGDPVRRAEEEAVGRPHPLVPALPWEFTFDEAARELLLAYQDRTTDAAAPGGEWDRPGLAELVRRLADHAHRLATLLAILRSGGIEGGGEVTADDVGRAIRLLDRYFLVNAEGVHRRAVFDPIGDDAEVVLSLVRERGEITMRTLLRALPHGGRGWGKAKGQDRTTRLDVAVDALASQGRVLVEAAGRGSRVVRAVGD